MSLILKKINNLKETNIYHLINKWKEKIDLFDIEIIIANKLKKNQAFIIAHPEFKLNFWQKLKIEKELRKRAKNIPLAYLTGKKEFYSREFFVNKNTLIPRPETELIIEKIVEKVKIEKEKNYSIFDIGTGSGNIIITLNQELKKITNKNFNFFASDISKKALKIAEKNNEFYQIKNILFFYSNLLQNKELKKELKKDNCKTLIIANLPYVNKDFKKKLLKKETSKSLKFEPKSALWSKDKGLKHYDKLLNELKEIFSEEKNFTAYFEISPEQKEYLNEKIKKYFPEAKIKFEKDLANLNRLCIWQNF